MNGRVNLMLPEVRANPYPIYAELRRKSPVCEVDPGGVWAVARYSDVQFVLKNPELFSSAGFQSYLKPAWVEHNPIASSILVMDAPAHGKYRGLVSRAFTTRLLASMEVRVRAVADQLADRLLARGEVDFMAEFATPLPAAIIGELLGIETSQHGNFKRWGADMSAITPAPPSEELVTSVRKTLAEMAGYLQEVVDARRRAPANDLVSELIRARVDGEVLTDAEILSFLFLLLPAGFETTANLLANAMLGFLDRPGDFARLRAEPALVPAFIEEVLRHDSPVHGIPRIATADVELGGATVPKGAMVLVLLGSANRDEAQFPDPDRFDLGRDAQGGVAFGHGAHFCLGAALTRMEGRIGIEALLSRFQGFSRLADKLEWTPTLTVRGPVTLPVRCLPVS